MHIYILMYNRNKSKCYILMICISNYYYFGQKCDRVFSEEISRVFYQTCESIRAIRKLIRTCFKDLKCAPAEFLIRGILRSHEIAYYG